MSGIEQLRKHQPFLQKLVQASDFSERKRLIEKANTKQLECIPCVVYNSLKGTAKLPPRAQRHLNKHRNKFRSFINKCCSPTINHPGHIHVKPAGIRRIREQLSQQRGGFLPLLLPLLALAGKAALAGAVSAGTGLAIKKIASSS